jgi:hypothetical protein
MEIRVTSLWYIKSIGLDIRSEGYQTFCDITLEQAKKLQEDLGKAIKSYEHAEKVTQENCAPDKVEVEDPKPSDLMNF